jgi:hypothetical protein
MVGIGLTPEGNDNNDNNNNNSHHHHHHLSLFGKYIDISCFIHHRLRYTVVVFCFFLVMSNVIDIGTMNNPVVYELMTDMSWINQPFNLEQWIAKYVTARYGYSGDSILQVKHIDKECLRITSLNAYSSSLIYLLITLK